MSKRRTFTTISPLPGDISRDFVIEFLHNHLGMIDLNPLVKERHSIKPPPEAPADEKNCIWYSLTDRITYLPGGLASGDVSYTCAFHDLPNGIQTHCRAPLGVDIQEKWTLNGTLAGEAPEPVELGIGAPATGLYIREDVDLRCNFLMAGFVKRNLTKAHAKLVDRLVGKAKLVAARQKSLRTNEARSGSAREQSQSQPQQQQQPQPQPPPPANVIRRSSAQRAMSPPPQLGSPFIAGYQLDRRPSVRVVSPEEGEEDFDTPANIAHRKSHSGESLQSRILRSHGSSLSEAPAPLRLGSPPPPQNQSQPPPTLDPTLYPQPLRVRNVSVGSGQSATATPPPPGSPGGQHAVPFPDLGSPSAMTTTATGTATAHGRPSVSESRGSVEENPEYPQLNPYSGAGSSPAESLPPGTPQFVAELGGDLDGPPVISDGDYLAALRPAGTSLKLPFVAEME